MQARCARGASVKQGTTVKGTKNGWGPYSKCPAGMEAVGLSKLDMLGSGTTLHVNDFECRKEGCRSWCWNSDCSTTSRCVGIATKPSATMKFVSGKKITNPKNQWSPWSTCPAGTKVLGIEKLDITGGDNNKNHVNDIEVSDNGARAWCWNAG